MELFEFKYKSRVTEILPNTKRTLERRQKQLAEEQQKKREQESLMKAQEEQQKQLKQLLKEQEIRKKMEEDRKKEEERKNQEELQQINTLKGEFGNMINDLQTDQSKLDYTISGLDLRHVQIRILMKVAETNSTLKGLGMSRKKITDEEGSDLVKGLEKNQVLERLELDGNFLGPKTISGIASMLQVNRSIRVIDLEGNDLTLHKDNQDRQDAGDISGVMALAEAIKKNDCILSLNLNNTNLTEECGAALVEAIEINETLIMLDIENNPKISLHDIRRIQELLKRNKKIYDDERYREFIERKRMSNEEQISSIILIKKEEKNLAQEGIDRRIDSRKDELEKQWNIDMEKNLQDQAKLIAKLQKESELRKNKRGRKKPVAKKK